MSSARSHKRRTTISDGSIRSDAVALLANAAARRSLQDVTVTARPATQLSLPSFPSRESMRGSSRNQRALDMAMTPGRYTPEGADISQVNLALGLDRDGNGTMSFPNSFPSFLENNGSNNGAGGVQRQAPSPGPNAAANGGGAGINGMGVGLPMNAGQQADVNLVYQKLMELSDVLKDNREKTQGIVKGAEEIATRAAATGANPSITEANAEISAARIADLNRQLAEERDLTRVLKREQRENFKLIHEYEDAVTHIVKMVRDFSYAQNMEKIGIRREMNKLLQDEKDAHLASRLEKDEWHARFMRSVEMIRTAYRLRCEEEEVPTRVVAGLQNEVRAYRAALGMEPERFEDEYGYEILKDVVNGAGEP